ncbi:MAG: FAD-dependent oxidoreductase [Deltaproteobacteria bacterium]|nr:FAD-dependent oxidoreductase [Deltaproteobacteria bacterium]
MKKKYSFDVPVTEKKNVVVLGGGPAGVVAALAARRTGADTLLIERASFLGGMMTGGLVVSLHGYRFHNEYVKTMPMSNWDTSLIVKGISLEVVTRLQRERGTLDQGHLGDPSIRENFDAEVMVHVLDQMMEESKVDILFNTFAFDVVMEGNSLKGVAIANKSGPQIILSDVVVDATGDADIAAAAGVHFVMGREKDGRGHGGALTMEVGGIDVDRLIEYLKNRPQKTGEELKRLQGELSEWCGGGGQSNVILTLDGKKGYFSMGGVKRSWEDIEQDRREGKYLMLPGVGEEWLQFLKQEDVPSLFGASENIYPRPPMLGWYGILRKGKMRYDQTHTGLHEAFFDQTKEEEISKAIIYMRKMDRIYMKFFNERIPGFGDAYIIKTSPMAGTRESRRIIGEYTLTGKDCVKGHRFSDVIAKCGRACNVHSPTGVWGEWLWLEPEKPYDIPYRCLIPEKIDNILVAGRSISVDYIAHGAIRAQPNCMSIGEAAGTAAALSAQFGVPPRKLDIEKLQDKLVEHGAQLFLEEENN